MGWNGFVVMTLVLGEKTEATICENIGMDDKEMALGTHDGDDVDAFFQLRLAREHWQWTTTRGGRDNMASMTR